MNVLEGETYRSKMACTPAIAWARAASESDILRVALQAPTADQKYNFDGYQL